MQPVGIARAIGGGPTGQRPCWQLPAPFVPNGQALLLAQPLFCLQIAFLSFQKIFAGNECKYHFVILNTVTK